MPSLLATGNTAAADHVMYIRGMMGDSDNSPPKWLLPVSVGIGLLTILFLMTLVAVSLVGYVVPQGSRFVLVAVLAFGAAFAAAGWLGKMTLSGEIPSLENQKPLVISAGGGFAVFVFVFVLGYYLYIK